MLYAMLLLKMEAIGPSLDAYFGSYYIVLCI